MDDSVLNAIHQNIQDARRILTAAHIRPDGDAVGSLVGLGLALQAAGKEVQMVLVDKVPASYRFLEGANQVLTKATGKFDCVIVLDCSDLLRSGDALKVTGEGGETTGLAPDINIDHHPTNLEFARLNLVNPEAVATSEILARHLTDFGLPLTQPVANALLTGIVTDTIGFRTSNMNPQVLHLAASLMDAGADLPEIYSHALSQRSFQAARYWGAGLSKLKREGPLVWTTLTLADRSAAEYPGRDDADLINVMSAIEGAEVALLLVEQKRGAVKVSWRAQPGLDVSQIALRFGGGGHKAAAGAEIEGALDDVQDKVLMATRELFSNFNGHDTH
ncbi:MAG: DHH family phosphoesterase [Omnitrophica WOR_2 bacterium]